MLHAQLRRMVDGRSVDARLPRAGAGRRVAWVMALGMLLWAAPRPAAAAAQVFTATLTGAQQVPPWPAPARARAPSCSTRPKIRSPST